MNFFDDAFNFLIEIEKTVYTNDPKDSGGPTRFGVTLRSYASFVGRPVLPLEIENLTEGEAKIFYLERYWKPLACDKIKNFAIAAAIFDSGVLYGVGTASLIAQEALSERGFSLRLDGHVGDNTLRALSFVEPGEFLKAFSRLLVERIDHIVALNPKNKAYRNGWASRAKRLLTLNTGGPFNKETS